MHPIICSNSADAVVNALKEYLRDGKNIKDIQTIESKGNQIVFLVDDKVIKDGFAEIWWSGYSEGMKIALES